MSWREWNETRFKGEGGEEWLLKSAPDWNAGYFTKRMEFLPQSVWVDVLEDVKRRKSKCEYRIDNYNKVFIIYDNSAHEMFHSPKEIDMTDIVLDRLRTGKPVPPEPPEPVWVAPADVWSI